MERKTFTAYKFTGMRKRCMGNEVTKNISLHKFLRLDFDGYDTKDLFERPYSCFESEEMTLEDVRKAIAEGTVFFPITVTCRKRDVLEYVERGFNVRLMRFTEYRRLLKVYEG